MNVAVPVRPRALLAWLLWTAVLAAATAALVAGRGTLDKSQVSLALLLVVLFGTASAGRSVGLWLAGTSFLVFNWFFLPPYGTLTLRDPLDWLVLVVYLITSIVAAQLLARAREETAAARARAAQIDRLATLGAETLNVGRAEDALVAIATVIREATAVERCEILARADGGAFTLLGVSPSEALENARAFAPGSLVAWVGSSGTAALERADGTQTRLDAPRPAPATTAELATGAVRALLLPLRVRERTVGVLRLETRGGVRLDAERWSVLDAISYYAALGVERVRLVAEAEHAEALREADRLKDALLASVSHDLRTPLTTIKALAHDLGALGDERAEIIEHEADRLNRLVADLLDLSRLSGGALTLRIEVNALDELLGALVQQAEPALGARKLVVSLPADESLILARFDLVHSLRALVNLVENAAKYSPVGEPIEVSARQDGAMLRIDVADRGPGVPAAEVDRIFAPFHRLPGGAPDSTGAGLGLSIARGLAEAQGGTLTYAPRAGGGSVFTLSLPVAAGVE